MSYLAILSLLFIFSPHFMNAVVVGSNTAVSREALTTFPSADGDNEMRGFAAFENGFKLDNSATSCIFNSFFPIGDSMTLNGGTLSLSRDVIFEADFKTIGTVNANNYAFKFTTTVPITLPSGSAGGSTLTFVDNVIFSDAVNSVDWSYDDAEIATGDARAATANLTAFSFDGSALTQEDTALVAKNPTEHLRWRPGSTRHLAVVTKKQASSQALQVWEYNQGTTTLSRTDNINVGGSAVTAVGWNAAGTYVAKGQGTDLEVFSFDAGTGTLTSVTNITVTGSIQRGALAWDDSGSFIVIGTDATPHLQVYNFNGSTLSLDASQGVSNAVTAVDWSLIDDFIVVGISGGTNNLRIFSHTTGSLTEEESLAESNNVLAVHWHPDQDAADHLAVGLAQSANSEVRVYGFNSFTKVLALQNELDVAAAVNDIRWSHDGQYIAWADANLEVNVYQFVDILAGATFLMLDDIKLTINSDVTLANSLCFMGNSVIKGNGHAIDLSTDGEILLTGTASLLLEDVRIKNVIGNNVRCIDNVSTVSLCNVELIQNGDFTFGQGRIDVVGDTLITGTNQFIYQSDQVSTIDSHAKLMFGSGMQFKYDSQTTDRDLLAMTDKTSVLHLYETTLLSTSTGLQLTKGTLIVEGTCPVESEATVEAEGITLGDGVSASNDLSYKPLPESGLDLKSGFLVYKNVQG